MADWLIKKDTFGDLNVSQSEKSKLGIKLSSDNGHLYGLGNCKIHNALYNDYGDTIPVDGDCISVPGCCYKFIDKKYIKTEEYMDSAYVGICSDTFGFDTGCKQDEPHEMTLGVAGFVLAYVDKEYKCGTPLTCTSEGYLTEIFETDKVTNPDRIIARYWKPESKQEFGGVKVNGRHWVRIIS